MKKQDMMKMRCSYRIENGHKVTSIVVMASQMMHHTHDYE